MPTQIWVNIGSGNSLLPNGTKPLPKVLRNSPEGYFTGNTEDIYPWNELDIDITSQGPMGQHNPRGIYNTSSQLSPI